MLKCHSTMIAAVAFTHSAQSEMQRFLCSKFHVTVLIAEFYLMIDRSYKLP